MRQLRKRVGTAAWPFWYISAGGQLVSDGGVLLLQRSLVSA